jgi:hypothetical protein
MVLYVLPLSARAADDINQLVKGLSKDEALRMGEAMYRTGILPSGEMMKAVVKSDVPVDGKMFTCTSCHLRSGFGTSEGTVRTPPISGNQLYSPLSRFKGVPMRGRQARPGDPDIYRPAYTDETLARVLLTGEDSAGRQINDIMPKYLLSDRDMGILVFYLKNLSSGLQPGISDTTLRFATIVTDDVPKEDRESMVGPLQFYLTNWRISKQMEQNMRSGAYVQEGTARDLRTLSLAIWELKGPSASWRGQLEDYYKKDPVFAVLGGIASDEWTPIHQFCEDHRIPAIFPITDFPVITDRDWYTLYLSKGFYQEGDAAAKYLHGRDDMTKDIKVLQVFKDEEPGRALSKSFQETWLNLGHKTPENIVLDRQESLTEDFWKKLANKLKHVVVLLWLDANDFPALDSLANDNNRPHMVFASSSLLGKRLYTVGEKERTSLYITYPYSLPEESQKYKKAIEASLRKNNIPIGNPDIAFKMYSLFSTLTGPLARMRSFAYRDYFLELIESTPDLSITPVVYPRLSFGAGQRYASKGCYIVQLTGGPNPGLVPRSEWVIH